MALYEEKMAGLPVDTSSYGAAARGHIMEQFAIEAYNQTSECTREAYHWDDCIIIRTMDDGGKIGFSPDGTDMPQGTEVIVDANTSGIKEITEVKSYSSKEHIQAYYDEPDTRKERMQLAAAGLVLPQLEVFNLVFFNPKSRCSVFSYKYGRDDLIEEISNLHLVYDMYIWNVNHYLTMEHIEPAIKEIDIWNLEMNNQPVGIL